MPLRLGVDVGGTFTDVILYDEDSGSVEVGKVPSTPGATELGVVAGVDSVARSEELAATGLFLHGNTVGLNALLERDGAVVGLLVTRGFRDVLEIRRGERDETYNVLWKPPAPLVPRRLRIPVTERMSAAGEVLIPLYEEDVVAALRFFEAEGVDSIAIAFLNSYANPLHEVRAEELVRGAGFAGAVSLSHRISREFREYERTSTTVVDAFIRPKTTSYLRRLSTALRDRGFAGACLVTRSGGGSLSFEEAEQRCFETIMSGPVAGVVGGAEVCRELGIETAITADVGGTTFDCALIVDGRPQVKYEGSIAGAALQTSWVDIRSIGAGGGSIAYVDHGGLLRVGPRSAGAVPGPACYGRGGTDPTVTDAALVLGMLGEGNLAGGIRLDSPKAAAALQSLVPQLGLGIRELAMGILRISAASMAEAIRSVTVERGVDPREAVLIPFGGAGPVFATQLARELGIGRIVVPQHAGNFSAWGLLGQDIVEDRARSMLAALDTDGLGLAYDLVAVIRDELEVSAARCVLELGSRWHDVVSLDLRYEGQEYTLTIPIASSPLVGTDQAEEIRTNFDREYERTFGHALDAQVEIVTVRVSMRLPLPRRSSTLGGDSRATHALVKKGHESYSFSRQEWLPFALVDRSALSPGMSIAGPAIVLEETATTYLDADFGAKVLETGALMLSEQGEV